MSDEVLRVTEGTEVSVKIDVSCTVRGKEEAYFIDRVLDIADRNAMREALQLYGISYVIDPASPYAELSDQPQAVDFLQFPREAEDLFSRIDELIVRDAAAVVSVQVPAVPWPKR